jgi:hypothetical protein
MDKVSNWERQFRHCLIDSHLAINGHKPIISAIKCSYNFILCCFRLILTAHSPSKILNSLFKINKCLEISFNFWDEKIFVYNVFSFVFSQFLNNCFNCIICPFCIKVSNTYVDGIYPSFSSISASFPPVCSLRNYWSRLKITPVAWN